MVIVARMSVGWYAPFLAGVMLAGTYIVGAVGDYAAHAWGWHGESLDRYGGDMGPTVGIAIAVFLSPGFFLAGLIVGLISRAVVLRRTAPSG